MSNAINEIQETIVKFYPVDLENISQSSGNANSVLPIYQNQIIETTLPVAELTCYEPLKTYEVEITKLKTIPPNPVLLKVYCIHAALISLITLQ